MSGQSGIDSVSHKYVQREDLSQSARRSHDAFLTIFEQLVDEHEEQGFTVVRLLEENQSLRARLEDREVESLHEWSSEALTIVSSKSPSYARSRAKIVPEVWVETNCAEASTDLPPSLHCVDVEGYDAEDNVQLLQISESLERSFPIDTGCCAESFCHRETSQDLGTSDTEKSRRMESLVVRVTTEEASFEPTASLISLKSRCRYKDALKEIEGIREDSRGSAIESPQLRKRKRAFPLWKTWQIDAKRLQRRLSKISKDSSKRMMSGSVAHSPRRSILSVSDGSLQRYVIMPNSRSRILWDLVGMTLLMYDMFMIPLLAFESNESVFSTVIALFALLFWSFDMVLSLLTGYVRKGVTIISPKLIRWHYYRTWFAPDAVLLLLDWLFTSLDLLAGIESGQGSLSKLLRTMRVFRVMRLLRLAKMRQAMATIGDFIDSEYMFLIFSVLKYLFLILWVNHFLAAGWYLVGEYSYRQGSRSWVGVDEGFVESPLAYRYFTCLHWSLSQFTPGTLSLQAQNTLERVYAVNILILGLVLFSSFMSSITASMTQLQAMQGETSRQLWLLRIFLRQNHVEKNLSFRLQRYLEYATSHVDNFIAFDKVTIMKLLSEQLSDELQYTVSYTVVHIHPLFHRCMDLSSVTMFKLSRRALSIKSLAPNDILFVNERETGHMYFVPRGCIRYMKGEEQAFTRVEEDDWLCEQALWTRWLHLGDARALKESDIVSLQVEAFGKEMLSDAGLHGYVAAYALEYVQWLNGVKFEDLSDVTLGFESSSLVSSFLAKEIHSDVAFSESPLAIAPTAS